MLQNVWICLVIALVSACIAISVTQQEMFRPLRQWAARKHAMAGHLFSCFYCFSHWVVFAGIVIYRPVVVTSGNTLVDSVVTAFFTVGLSALCSGVILQVIRIAIAKASEELDLINKTAK
ncbi:hypothetical protein A7K99_11275 [Tatumella citrea]|uniref:DUF1360 domain-containing protein n=1 Tax=Tatumella citrea TaxID=53336 RepID=A0A1Y0LEF5_TATCI|nr:hypothetical protein A7K98_11275 [Tatumella citrea]ARV00192.1 hypothetical protein A7K99_11275 [Tatumella citrea]